MMVPTVHLNGTGQRALLDELEAAYLALGTAILAVRQVTVHGRDYYVQGEHAYGQAREEMDRRLDALTSVQGDLRQMYTTIEAQGRK